MNQKLNNNMEEKDQEQIQRKEESAQQTKNMTKIAQDFIENNEQTIPVIFLLSFIIPLIFAGATSSALIGIVIIFAIGYLILKFGFNFPKIESSIFSMFFSLTFLSVVFRFGLLFSNTATAGFAAVIISIIIIGLIRKFKPELFPKIELIKKDRTKTLIFAIIIVFLSLISYSAIAGKINPQKILWNGADANWQTSEMDHIVKDGIFQINPTKCQGIENYDLDSYTSTVSLIPPYMIMFFGQINASEGQQIINYLGFSILCLGVYILFSSIFDAQRGLVAALFVSMPFVMQPYLPEFYGIWRLTLFNYIFPYVAFLAIEGIALIGNLSLMSMGLAFLVSIQPFSAILLAPTLITTGIKEMKTHWPKYLFLSVLIICYFYFAFYQIVFQSVANSGKDYTFSLGFDNNQKIEMDPLLDGKLKLSYENIGSKTIIGVIIATIFVIWINWKNKFDCQKREFALLGLFLFGLIISSGFVYFGDTINQYVMKSRYTFLLTMAFPIGGVILWELKQKNKIAFAVATVVLLINAIGTVGEFTQTKINEPNIENNLVYRTVSWFKGKNFDKDEYVMYFDRHFPQNIQLHIPIRHVRFIQDKPLVQMMSKEDLIQKEELWNCKFIREGLFTIKKEELIPKKVESKFVISSDSSTSEQRARFNNLLENSGYEEIHREEGLVVYEKK